MWVGDRPASDPTERAHLRIELTQPRQGLHVSWFLLAKCWEERRPGPAQCEEQLTGFLSSALLCSDPGYGTQDKTDLSTNPYSAMRQSQDSLPRGDGAKMEWKCPRKNSTGQQWVRRPHCWTLTTGAPGPSQSPVPGEWDTVGTVKTTPHKPLSACFLISKTNKQKKRKNNYCEYILHLYITNRVCS